MTKPSLDEIIDKFESAKQEYLIETRQVEQKVFDLEKLKAIACSDVEKDSSSPEKRSNLLKIENDVNELKRTLREKQVDFSKESQNLRLKFIDVQRELSLQIKDRIKNLENEREQLRSELIPDAEKRVNDLNERKKKLDIEILNLLSRMHELEKEGEQWLQGT